MNVLTDIYFRDLSGGTRFEEFISQLPAPDAAIGYFGSYDSGRLNATLQEMKTYLGERGAELNSAKRAYSMAVECFDNIRNYYSFHPADKNMALLSLTVEGNHYCITAGNSISREDAFHLRKRLEILHTLNAEELDREFLETLLLPARARAKGAGLGLILMARRKGNFVDHYFEELPHTSFFYIRIKLAA
ncbi:MAG: hypothetical protein IT233_11955 [Bacteroidia bacterium]|nr:hypothetical protein [Bacteroidia bacterium]